VNIAEKLSYAFAWESFFYENSANQVRGAQMRLVFVKGFMRNDVLQ